MNNDDLLDPMHDDHDELPDPVQAQAASWFARLRAEDVSADDRQQADAWLAASPEHRAAYQRMQQLWAMLGDFAASAEVDARMPASVPSAQPAAAAPVSPAALAPTRNTTRRPRHRLRWLAASAAALVGVAIGWKMLMPPAQQQYATAPGQQRSFNLDDGTRVDLDTASRLLVHYDAKERRITLQQGRAFFRVAKDPQRPLSVDTDSGSVRAIGTRFEVDRHDGSLSVALFEGKVQLRQTGAEGKVIGELTPGQRAQVSGSTVQVHDVSLADSPAWTRGQLVFDEQPLDQAVAEFNRYGGTPIRVDDATLRQLKISGVFHSNDTAGFLDALHAAYRISNRNDGQQIQLYR